MKITVATVCYNSQDYIRKTIESVLAQTYKDIEYLIIDGASKDDTMKIIGEYSKKNIKVVSEPDKGLYDAMNKAADMATGDYIVYMNSGDIFATETSLEEVAPFLENRDEMVYGNVIRDRKSGAVLEKYHGKFTLMSLLLQGKMMCHQSILTRTDIMRQYRFNTDLSITADYDFVMRMKHDKRKLTYVDVTVSHVDNIEGISATISNNDKMREQDDISLKANFPVWYYLVTPPKSIVRFFRRINERK